MTTLRIPKLDPENWPLCQRCGKYLIGAERLGTTCNECLDKERPPARRIGSGVTTIDPLTGRRKIR